ncbi:MAG: transcriptional regulator [Mariniblastus sp.]
MTIKSNQNSKNEQLPLDLNDLISAVQGLPEDYRKQLEQPLNRVVEYTRRRRRILNLIQEALSQLRMDMKYLMFDLEATRRERDTYKNALEGEV